ncbi:triose-phosphate isomerase [Kamptonema cortianum]|nr:triose-phosphate isomerase [Geitlerinema splendidum]MDK3160433.1 triose-phosphate isomerase [Kamptonema cortianum]
MRTKLVAGNWKMNLTTAQGGALVESFIKEVNVRYDIDVIVCPPYLSIPRIAEICRRSSVVKVGAQDVHWPEEGAFTGKVSAKQLAEYSVDYCIVGHSETRGKFGKLEVPESTIPYFAESDETINLKLKSLLYYGIMPILCVGETLAERQAGQTDGVIAHQLARALDGIDPAEMYTLVIAYEPVWAIGTGEVCSADEAERVCANIRGEVARLGDPDLADFVRVLYGGSVKPDNAKELFEQPNIDGGLVGGASLNAKDFAQIVALA